MKRGKRNSSIHHQFSVNDHNVLYVVCCAVLLRAVSQCFCWFGSPCLAYTICSNTLLTHFFSHLLYHFFILFKFEIIVPFFFLSFFLSFCFLTRTNDRQTPWWTRPKRTTRWSLCWMKMEIVNEWIEWKNELLLRSIS